MAMKVPFWNSRPGAAAPGAKGTGASAPGAAAGSAEGAGPADTSGATIAQLSTAELLALPQREVVAMLEASRLREQRLLADCANIRRRSESAAAEARAAALRGLARDLLPFLDALDYAIRRARETASDDRTMTGPGSSAAGEAGAETAEPPLAGGADAPTVAETAAGFRAGFEAMYVQVATALQRNGIERIHPLGEAFDPTTMEALALHLREGLEGPRVVRVERIGWRLGDKVIRPASVVVEAPPEGVKPSRDPHQPGE